MSVHPIFTDWYPANGVWIDYSKLECDFCDAIYPPSGLFTEFPLVMWDARCAGWMVLRLTNLACCPDCHWTFVNEAPP